MSLRERYNAFIDRHEIAWELTFAALAIVYVLVGFASPETGAELEAVFLANVLLTIVFAAEFLTRLLAAYDRRVSARSLGRPHRARSGDPRPSGPASAPAPPPGAGLQRRLPRPRRR